MTDLLPLEELPAPAPVGAARGRPRRSRLRLSIATGVAGAVGFAGTAVLGDARRDEGEQASVTNNAVAEPVLVPSADGAELASAGTPYGVSPWSSDTRTAVLGGWGTLADGALPEPSAPGLAEDPRLADPATPAFTDPCAAAAEPPAASSDDDRACPEDVEGVRAAILGDRRLPPNHASVHAYPGPDVRAAAPCRFDELADGQIPVAVVTANPGAVTVTVGDQEASITSPDGERDAWEEWIRRPVGVRPVSSFVAHCLAVDRPDGRGPYLVRAEAVDEEGQVARAITSVSPFVERVAPLRVTPLDGTMVQVDVALPAGDDAATVLAVPLALVAGAADCQRVTPELAESVRGWRPGSTSLVAVPATPGRPWLESAPRRQRTTVALAEGEPNLLCATYGAGAGLRRVTLVVVPPDARRLAVVVSEVQLRGAPPGGAVEVVGTFAELGWSPCGAAVPALGAGVSDPGFAGILCTSGGDAGAIAGAGGVLDVSIRAGGSATHTARLALSAAPGGEPVEAYRLPIPVPELDGILCTPGADQPSCVAPGVTTSLGTLVLAARWDEGPIGAGGWEIRAPA